MYSQSYTTPSLLGGAARSRQVVIVSGTRRATYADIPVGQADDAYSSEDDSFWGLMRSRLHAVGRICSEGWLPRQAGEHEMGQREGGESDPPRLACPQRLTNIAVDTIDPCLCALGADIQSPRRRGSVWNGRFPFAGAVYARRNDNRSALICSAWVVGMPCGKPG